MVRAFFAPLQKFPLKEKKNLVFWSADEYHRRRIVEEERMIQWKTQRSYCGYSSSTPLWGG